MGSLRVVPRGAFDRWTLEGALTHELGIRSPWAQSAARAGFEWLRAAYTRMMGAREAAWWIRQLRLSLAGCTAVMDPGDVLLFSSDIFHQTQGTEADRLTIILSSCENCHTAEGQGPKLKVTRRVRSPPNGLGEVYRRMVYGDAAARRREPPPDSVSSEALREEFQRAYQSTTCEPWCVHPCGKLNGNVASECGGCSSGCHPGGAGYPQA